MICSMCGTTPMVRNYDGRTMLCPHCDRGCPGLVIGMVCGNCRRGQTYTGTGPSPQRRWP